MIKRNGYNEQFGDLLKAGISSIAYCEGRTAQVIEEELGAQIGLSGHTIQRYKTGKIPAEQRTIEILAEACVRRGHFNRAWVMRFLRAAGYPSPTVLADHLCPPTPALAIPVVYHNLPAATYRQFVMRADEYNAIADALSLDTPVVVLIGLGGVGKTSLAREVATHCLTSAASVRFQAAVWISDKDYPGTTNLDSLLNTIARTLDYPGLAKHAREDKRLAVEQLLRSQPVLLVLDNAETITDSAVLNWVLQVPQPSRVLITTRSIREQLRDCALIFLDGMTDTEAQALIHGRLRTPRLTELANTMTAFAPLIAATGGNPKAIELALGLLKYGRPLHQLIDDLQTARHTLFDDLFSHAWSLLVEAAQHTLLALTLFPTSANQSALQTSAGISDASFEAAIEALVDLALVDVQPLSLEHTRYALHPLVRAFARSKLAERQRFEEDARLRWLEWYRWLAEQVGFCWDDLPRLALLDPEHETLHNAINWAFAQGMYPTCISLIEGVRYYYNVRGLWDSRVNINLLRAHAARQINDRANTVTGLAHQSQILSKQGQLAETAAYLEQIDTLLVDEDLPLMVRFEVGHARALHLKAQGRLAEAEQVWRNLLALSTQLGGQPYVINQRWLANCQLQMGNTAVAQQLFCESLRDAQRINDQRSVVGNSLKLADIELAAGQLESARARLDDCHAAAAAAQDRRRLGEWHHLMAQLQRHHGNLAAARSSLIAALDLFERLGMRREVASTRAELDQLAEIQRANRWVPPADDA